MSNRTANVALLISSLLIVLFTLYLIAVNYTSGAAKDDWELIPFLEQAHSGALPLAMLWEPYGGAHRIVLTKLLFLADYRFFNGTNILQTTTATLLQLSVLLLWICAACKAPIAPLKKSVVVLIAALFLFHSVQLFNLTYAFDCQWFISTAAAIAALYLHRTRAFSIQNTLLIVVLSIAASLGNAAGWMIWPSLLACSILMRARTSERLIWLSVLIVMTSLWTHNIHPSAPMPELPPWHQWVPEWITSMAVFLVRLLGNPWTPFHNSAGILLGCSGLIAFSYCLLRHRRHSQTFFLSIALYACLTAMAITLGRAGFEQEAATPRFYTITLLFWAGLLSHIALQPRTQAGVLGVFACLIALPLHIHHAQANTAMTERARHAQFALMIGMQDWSAINSTLPWYMQRNHRNPGRDHVDFLQQQKIGYYQLPQAAFMNKTILIPEQYCSQYTGEFVALEHSGEYSLLFRHALPGGLWLTTDAHGAVNGALRQYRPPNWLLPMAWLSDGDDSWHGYSRSEPTWAVRIENQHANCRLPLQPSAS